MTGTRIWLGVVTVFWLAMGVLLWRVEFGSRGQPGSIVPVAMVWQKILTAPDSSQLEIRHHTNRVGYCRWRPEVGQEMATGAQMLDEEPVEGMVQGLSHYTLDFDGNLTLPDFPTRVRFSATLKLDTNRTWQTFETELTIRPDVYGVKADAVEKTVDLRVNAGGDRINRQLRFADLQNPQKLLQELGGPMFPAMVTAMGVPLSTNQLSPASVGWRWEARNDSLLIGRNRVRAYRLHARLVGRYSVTIFVSPVGEILRAELPGHISLVNDAISGLRRSENND
jgi:hypothetical protein